MDEPDLAAWTENATGRERVRMVVETLEAPATVADIADAANVAWETADSELDRLVAEHVVREVDRDGQRAYGPDPVRQFVDEVLELIESHTRDELEAQLVEYQDRLESLAVEYDAADVDEFRTRLTDEDRTAEQLREIRSVAETWDALETERRLVRQALNLYDDVARFARTAEDAADVTG